MKIDWEGERSQVWFVLLPQGIRKDAQFPTSCDSPGQGSSQGQLGAFALIALELGVKGEIVCGLL